MQARDGKMHKSNKTLSPPLMIRGDHEIMSEWKEQREMYYVCAETRFHGETHLAKKRTDRKTVKRETGDDVLLLLSESIASTALSMMVGSPKLRAHSSGSAALPLPRMDETCLKRRLGLSRGLVLGGAISPNSQLGTESEGCV